MANINISDLRPAGADLFLDSESFMMDLSEEELDLTGGWTFVITSSKPCIVGGAFVVGAVAGWVLN
ncbi:hypothetical protein [Okeania sp. SIO2B9]|uniref:hypothetical protein n=1 Tax=Okeania sp. SIO2B9 TaxID=2607782 RepID=UPI0014298B14|nr:hypothetical protein [Okeania sp. SIO2B9]NES91861.1 hypothetical protein [Okeania sp. SIO2B9]